MRARIYLVAAMMSLSATALAAHKPLNCQTNFGEKSFTIQGNSIAFHQQDQGRSISSVLTGTSRASLKGFSKTVYKDGHRHFIHIENINQLSSNNDFLAVTSPKGHKMTYPIHCSQLD